jgi:hypothetical protein
MRLEIKEEVVVENFELIGYDIMSDGSVGSRGRGEKRVLKSFVMRYRVIPLTGWLNSNR